MWSQKVAQTSTGVLDLHSHLQATPFCLRFRPPYLPALPRHTPQRIPIDVQTGKAQVATNEQEGRQVWWKTACKQNTAAERQRLTNTFSWSLTWGYCSVSPDA